MVEKLIIEKNYNASYIILGMRLYFNEACVARDNIMYFPKAKYRK